MSGPDHPLRVLLVGRHFWPQGSIDSAGHLIALASALRSAGIVVSVLTPRYSNAWAERFSFREFHVVRPLQMFRSGWAIRGDRTVVGYLKCLRRWIASNSTDCDLVFCDGCREEAIAVVEAARAASLPVVIQIADQGPDNDFEFFSQGRLGKQSWAAAQEADAVVLDSAAAQRRWLASGGDPTKVVRIPICIGPTIDVALPARRLLRQSLSRINGDLHVPESCAVVLSVERMTRQSGIMTLVNQAYSLSQQIPGLQYWLIGDGPLRDSIATQRNADGLRQSIAMPGSFGIDDDVYAVADLMVHAGREGFRHQIPAAISAALPLVLANTAEAREFFAISANEVQKRILQRRDETMRIFDPQSESVGDGVWWFDTERPKTLRFAIQQVLADLDSARSRAQWMRKQLQRKRHHGESIGRYVNLFDQLVETTDKLPGKPNPLETSR